tara:strand:+ start:895 stop:1074 length:180 start_codon:yes stop_codon:yes gene_type:complete
MEARLSLIKIHIKNARNQINLKIFNQCQAAYTTCSIPPTSRILTGSPEAGTNEVPIGSG